MSEKSEIQIAYEPSLVPPPSLMAHEGITVLEEWFRWAEEWSMLLRIYGEMGRESSVLEIGCGLGRIAFALRYLLEGGHYTGFEICGYKIVFLKEHFEPAHPNFNFIHANIHNTEYNPNGVIRAADYQFPMENGSVDLVFAASVFTHMLPEGVERYIQESSRVLRTGGRCVFSWFLLDHYRPGQLRPAGFRRPNFDFQVPYGKYGDSFAAADPKNLEHMTAYRLALIEQMARPVGLTIVQTIPGLWSGSSPRGVGAQDLVVLTKSSE